ncbi:MAG: M6 family metalloprotease domain-containing protein [Lentimicrobium sp.]|nr:M6 family metalloprotease domain-containing protein [Lentimicrobium sp.]
MNRYIILFIAFILLFAVQVHAVNVQNQPCQVKQPDGEVINCFVSGDEYFNWLHDEAGYTIIQAADGYYYYGLEDKGSVIPSDYKVNTVDAGTLGLKRGAKISRNEYLRRKEFLSDGNSRSSQLLYDGNLNNLVVYIKFQDDTEFPDSRLIQDEILNLPSGNSLKSYYNEVSYAHLTINSTHYPECSPSANNSYTAVHSRNYYEPYNASTNQNGYSTDDERRLREHGLLKDALDWININSPVSPSLDIDSDENGQVDNVCFIVRGNSSSWAGLLWAHQWVLSSYEVTINGKQVNGYTFIPESQFSVPTLSHEMFHALGAPDLYHYDDEGLNISPVAEWDIMGTGSGHMTAYMKWKYTNYTWINSIPEITVSGTYTLQPLTSANNNCYKIASPNSDTEYFVIEYRRSTGAFEGNRPGSGLVVYRINPEVEGNTNGPPDEIYVYRPEGTTNNNGNPWNAFLSEQSGRTAINDGTNPFSFLQNGNPGGLNIFNVSSAGNTISFSVGISSVVNPNILQASAISENQISLFWQNNFSDDEIILAVNTSPAFGAPEPGFFYTAGSQINGGGIVLASGAASAYLHDSLGAATTCYYKLWSRDSSNHYSPGINAVATTHSGIYNLPFTETFSISEIPAHWSQQTAGTNIAENWTLSSTNKSGGNSNEIMSTRQNRNPGVIRLVTPPINTSGVAGLDLSFRYMLDDYGPGTTFCIQSSIDGIAWKTEPWSVQTAIDADSGPKLVNISIENNLNSPIRYFAFTIEGNLNQYDNLYIDDIYVCATIVESFNISISTNQTDGCMTTGEGLYRKGTEAVLTAISHDHYRFVNWTENGKIISNEEIYSFIVTGNRALTANFIKEYSVVVSSETHFQGHISGSEVYIEGQTATVDAWSGDGFSFLSWTENGKQISSLPSYTFTVNCDRKLVANFQTPNTTNTQTFPEVKVYPNPSKGLITIENSTSSTRAIESIELFDESGKGVFSRDFSDNPQKTVEDISFLPDGFYFLLIKTEYTKDKIVKVLLQK